MLVQQTPFPCPLTRAPRPVLPQESGGPLPHGLPRARWARPPDFQGNMATLSLGNRTEEGQKLEGLVIKEMGLPLSAPGA